MLSRWLFHLDSKCSQNSGGTLLVFLLSQIPAVSWEAVSGYKLFVWTQLAILRVHFALSKNKFLLTFSYWNSNFIIIHISQNIQCPLLYCNFPQRTSWLAGGDWLRDRSSPLWLKIPLPTTKDHCMISDQDESPNTGIGAIGTTLLQMGSMTLLNCPQTTMCMWWTQHTSKWVGRDTHLQPALVTYGYTGTSSRNFSQTIFISCLAEKITSSCPRKRVDPQFRMFIWKPDRQPSQPYQLLSSVFLAF